MERAKQGITISELARLAGVKLPTVRFYERRGMLPKPRRSTLGHRLFDGEDLLRIRFIKQAQSLCFSLEEVKELLALRIDPDTNREKVRRRAEVKAEQVKEKTRRLRAIERVLRRLVAECRGRGMAPGCPILEALESADGPSGARRGPARPDRA